MEHTTIPTIATSIESDEFSAGFIAGMTGVEHSDKYPITRFRMEGAPTEDGVIDIVRNLCEIAVEGWLTDELLKHDVGLLVGWVSRDPGLRVRFNGAENE